MIISLPNHTSTLLVTTIPQIIQITGTDDLKDLQISGSTLFPKRLLKWDNTNISILHNTPKPFTIPYEVSLTYWEGTLIKRMIIYM